MSKFRISLSALRLPVSIGCEEEERRTLQTVRFDLEIALPSVPAGGVTDEVKDTVDYGQLAEVVRTAATREPYRLLERLALVVWEELRPLVPPDGQLTLRVTKEQPPVANLEGGVTVTMTE